LNPTHLPFGTPGICTQYRAIIQYADLTTNIREEAFDFRYIRSHASPRDDRRDSTASESGTEDDEDLADDVKEDDDYLSSASDSSKSSVSRSMDEEGGLDGGHFVTQTQNSTLQTK